jgi:hypothetical protein
LIFQKNTEIPAETIIKMIVGSWKKLNHQISSGQRLKIKDLSKINQCLRDLNGTKLKPY